MSWGRFLLERGGLLGTVVAAVYIWLAPSHILDGDNAELATLGVTGGVAHPSGYPLYVLMLRSLQWLPGESPAHVAAMATALIAAASMVALHAACRAWGARPLGATLAVAVVAGAPIVMRISSEAEVFALNNLAVACVLWLAPRGGPLRGAFRVVALAFVAGLGLSNHMTCALVAPVGLLGVVRGLQEVPTRRALVAGIGVVAFACGLLPYAYLLLAPDTPLSWGTVEDLAQLRAHVLRADYGGPGAFLPTGQAPSIWTQLSTFGVGLARSWWYVGAVAGCAMLAIRALRGDREGESAWAWRLFAASWLLAGPLLVMRFNLEPTGLGLYVCQRFYVMPAVMLAIPISVALRPLEARLPAASRAPRVAHVVIATLGVMAVAASSLPYLVRVHTPAVEAYARNLLRSLPQDAVLFIGQDDEYLGIGYLQWALGERRDVTVVAAQLTGLPWYQRRIAARGIVDPEQGSASDLPIVRVIDGLLARGRPVFVEKARTEVIAARPTYPFATVMRVLAAGSPIPPVDEVVAENAELFEAFQLDYARPGLDDEFATVIHQRYAATWTTLARKAEQVGNREVAARARSIALELAPRP